MRLLPALCLTLIASLCNAGEPPETDWLALLPEEDLAALEAMPEIEHRGAEGDSLFYAAGGLRQQDDLPAVMYSTRTVAALDGQRVRLGGYPVPLESTPDGRFSTFFLVPYPGACIHVPPPPPNQIVLVRYPQGMELDDIYAPLWVSGTLRIEPAGNALADAAYALDAEAVRLVEEADL